MSSPTETRITSLIRLIDDQDEFVRDRVTQELVKIGEDAVPFLEIAARDENLLRRTSAQKALQTLFPMQLGERFKTLSQASPDIDLEEAVMLLMQFGDPTAEPSECRKVLDGFAQEIGARIPDQATPFQVIKVLTEYLFHEKGFSGNEKNYFSGSNTYFNMVLKDKSGIPISLSVLCILVAQRIGRPIVGVGMPCHFIAKYDLPKDSIYFDPFNKGRILSYEDCVRMVEGFGLKFEDHYLSQSTNREILARMMNNLITIYKQEKDFPKADQLNNYIQILIHRSKQ